MAVQVINTTSGEDKYIVNYDGIQKVMTGDEIRAAGGTVPPSLQEANTVHQIEVTQGTQAKEAYQLEQTSQKLGMTPEELKATPGGTLNQQLQRFADKYGMSLQAAVDTYGRWKTNPGDPEFASFNQWITRDFQAAGPYANPQTAIAASYERINQATKANPEVLKTKWVNGRQVNIINLEEAHKSGISREILNTAGRGNVPTLIKRNVNDSGIIYEGGFEVSDKDWIQSQLETQERARQKEVNQKALSEYNAAIEADKQTFEAKLKDAPQELRDAYKQGGIEAYNRAIDKWNENLRANYMEMPTGEWISRKDIAEVKRGNSQQYDILMAKGTAGLASEVDNAQEVLSPYKQGEMYKIGEALIAGRNKPEVTGAVELLFTPEQVLKARYDNSVALTIGTGFPKVDIIKPPKLPQMPGATDTTTKARQYSMTELGKSGISQQELRNMGIPAPLAAAAGVASLTPIPQDDAIVLATIAGTLGIMEAIKLYEDFKERTGHFPKAENVVIYDPATNKATEVKDLDAKNVYWPLIPPKIDVSQGTQLVPPRVEAYKGTELIPAKHTNEQEQIVPVKDKMVNRPQILIFEKVTEGDVTGLMGGMITAQTNTDIAKEKLYQTIRKTTTIPINYNKILEDAEKQNNTDQAFKKIVDAFNRQGQTGAQVERSGRTQAQLRADILKAGTGGAVIARPRPALDIYKRAADNRQGQTGAQVERSGRTQAQLRADILKAGTGGAVIARPRPALDIYKRAAEQEAVNTAYAEYLRKKAILEAARHQYISFINPKPVNGALDDRALSAIAGMKMQEALGHKVSKQYGLRPASVNAMTRAGVEAYYQTLTQAQAQELTQTKAQTLAKTALRQAVKEATQTQTKTATKQAVRIATRAAIKEATQEATKEATNTAEYVMTKTTEKAKLLKATKVVIGSQRIPVPSSNAPEKEKEAFLENVEGLVARRRGMLDGRPVWLVDYYPYGPKDKMTLRGSAPKGAKPASGKGSLQASATLLRGVPPSKPYKRDTGAVDDIIYSGGDNKIIVKSVKDESVKPRKPRLLNPRPTRIKTINAGNGIEIDRKGRGHIIGV